MINLDTSAARTISLDDMIAHLEKAQTRIIGEMAIECDQRRFEYQIELVSYNAAIKNVLISHKAMLNGASEKPAVVDKVRAERTFRAHELLANKKVDTFGMFNCMEAEG